MKQRLTESDRKKLKYSTRIGYIFGSFPFIATLILYYIPIFGQSEKFLEYVIPIGVLFSILLVWLLNRNYWTDLINNEKDILIKTVNRKESFTEYEAGSSVGFSTSGEKSNFYKQMNSHVVYTFIIDNVRHRVEKKIWEKVIENEEVEFHYSPKSKELLEIKRIK